MELKNHRGLWFYPGMTRCSIEKDCTTCSKNTNPKSPKTHVAKPEDEEGRNESSDNLDAHQCDPRNQQPFRVNSQSN